MASGKSIEAGGAYVRIFSDNAPLVRGLKNAQTLVSGFAKGLRSVGTKIAAPLALAGVTGLAGLMAMSDGFVAMGSTQRETAGQAAVLGVALARLRAATRVLSLSIFSLFAPALSTLFTWLARVAVGAAKWIRDNRSMIMTALAVAAAIAGVGVAIFALGTVLSMIATAIGGFLALWAGIGAVLGFVLSPLGLVLTALAAITTWILTSTQMGQGALAWLADAFGTLATDATTAWGGIVAAVQAGDLQAAFNIAMAFLRLEWVKVMTALESRWIEFKDYFVDIWGPATKDIAKFFLRAFATIAEAWVKVMSGMQTVWYRDMKNFRSSWQSLTEGMLLASAPLMARLFGQSTEDYIQSVRDESRGQQTQIENDANQKPQQIANDAAAQLKKLEDGLEVSLQTVDDSLGDGASARRKEQRQADEKRLADALAAAEKGFASAVSSVSKNPSVQDFGPGVYRATQAASASDIRSSEGLKSVMFALTGQSNPQQMALKYTQQIAANSTKQLEETEKTRKAVEDNAAEQERI